MPRNESLISHASQFLSGIPTVARILARNGGNMGALRTNDILRKDEWMLLDETLVGIARQRLTGINDLRSRGLVENLGGLGITLSQYEKLGDMSAADVDFAGVTDGEKDSVTFDLATVPVPVIHKSFSINVRRQMASEGASAKGQPIDRTQMETAAMKVTESMEDLLFNGFAGGTLDGHSIYGYTTESNRNTTSGADWGTVTNPQANVISAIAGCEADSYFGPYTLYVATTQFGELRNFHTDGSGDQAFDRLARIQGLEGVKPGDRLTAGSAVLVSMRRDVVDVAIGQDLMVVEWEAKGGLVMEFKVLAAMTPRVKSDAASKSGINHISGI